MKTLNASEFARFLVAMNFIVQNGATWTLKLPTTSGLNVDQTKTFQNPTEAAEHVIGLIPQVVQAAA